MNLLLVNDDGIASPALSALCQAAAARGHHVTVCAPTTQQSGKSHSFTVFSPVMVHPATIEGAAAAWAVDGTPVDCTRLGLKALAENKIDLVISGVNLGYNAGLATFVSGTVGAAREAAFQHVPSMAVSMHTDTPIETLRFLTGWTVHLGERLVSYPAPEQAVCNVNVPPVPVYQLQAPVMCPVSRHIYKDSYEKRLSPRGDIYFWCTPECADESPTPGSDVDLLNRNHITVSFLTPAPCIQEGYEDFLSDM